jgi:hypothetical protein
MIGRCRAAWPLPDRWVRCASGALGRGIAAGVRRALGWPVTFAVLAALAISLAPGEARAQRAGTLPFVPYEVTDPNFGGIRVASMAIPAGWRASSQVRWDYTSANYPVRVQVRLQSPDGKMWIELLPIDAVYWMDRFTQGLRVGQRSYGAVYAPNATIEQAMESLVIRPARGNVQGLKIVERRPVDPVRMAQAFKVQNVRGEAMAMRVRYPLGNATADEDFYTLYTAVQDIPYTGPQGTSHEYHRVLLMPHAVGAVDGLLPTVYPLLGVVIASLQRDPAYQQHMQAVSQHIIAQYNAALKRGYDSIAAAGQLSRTISANNDALLASMQQRRVEQNRADAARRAARGGGADANDAFSQYLRGTTRMNDPYWGTSERDSNYSYHWTDGQGNYRASNDPGFNPNIGGGGPNWQRMEVAR